MITGKQIGLKYKEGPHILKDVTFELKEGRITSFIGKSGAGKTTLLKCIANLNDGYDGKITCDGKDVKGLSPKERAAAIGFVLQQFHLFPHMDVLRNCTYALQEVLDVSQEEAQVRGIEVLQSLGMGSHIHAWPSQLSGGQQQRVAIARALLLNPQVLLLDEPTSALDPDSKRDLEVLLLDLNAKGITIGLSSHDMAFISRMIDCVYFLEDGAIVESWEKGSEELAAKTKIHGFVCGL